VVALEQVGAAAVGVGEGEVLLETKRGIAVGDGLVVLAALGNSPSSTRPVSA